MILLDKNSKRIENLHLGIVEAGTSKKFQFFIMNNTPAELRNIKIHLNHSE